MLNVRLAVAVMVPLAMLLACGKPREKAPRLAVISAEEAPALPPGVPKRQNGEPLVTYSFTTDPLAGAGGRLRVTWSSYVHDRRGYIEKIGVVSTTPVRDDLQIDIGTAATETRNGVVLHSVPFATTSVNRRGALVHHYFRVFSDGSHEFQGTYAD